MIWSHLVSIVVGTTCSLIPLFPCPSSSLEAVFPELLDATLDELRAGLDAGLFTSVDLIKAYTLRIHEVNGALNAVNDINPDALAIAADMDRTRAAGGSKHPLFGIPILIKDNIATHDKMNNTVGSYALVGAKVREDSTIVAKLRRAGAIILGKANLSEWAEMRGFNICSGWSAYGGQTLGAYFPQQNPSGSSSGSAVASALGLAWASVGTETSGSINHPSHLSNIVGIKPTVGLTSRYLVVPISEHQDTVGPMARTVKDAAYLLSALVGQDGRDNYTSAIPFDEDAVPDYVGACKMSGLQGKRLGVPWNMRDWLEDPSSIPAFDVFNDTLDLLRSAGAEIIDVNLPVLKYRTAWKDKELVADADFATDLPQNYLAQLASNPNNITSTSDLEAFTVAHPKERYPRYDTGAWDGILARGINNTSPAFWPVYAENVYYAGHLGVTGALRNHSLDALVMPLPYSYLLSSYIGTPTISVPLGVSPEDTPERRSVGCDDSVRTAPNQPFGLGFAGDAFSEVKLIEMAYAFEQRTMVRRRIRPYIQPKTELRDVVGRQLEL